jgi:E3 ubiquitin-protein ligase DOA10
MQCRFCLDTEVSQHDRFIQPCDCRGSAQYVHRSCLKHWMRLSPDPQICPVCNESYIEQIIGYEFIPPSTTWNMILNHTVFCCFLTHYGIILVHLPTPESMVFSMKVVHTLFQLMYITTFAGNFQVNSVNNYLNRLVFTYVPMTLFMYSYYLYRIMAHNDLIHCFLISIPMTTLWSEHLRVLGQMNE